VPIVARRNTEIVRITRDMAGCQMDRPVIERREDAVALGAIRREDAGKSAVEGV
jgi:hypothetical protein